MSGEVFLGGALVAAVVAGAIALFAPCCISVMLPAYFATSFQNRRLLVAMTFLFAAGVATVIVPIALGLNALRSVFFAQHTVVYAVAGVALLGLGGYLLLGGELHLPMPGRRGNATGPVSVYLLGVFAGITSTCCAPVLAGVVALSTLSPSTVAAAALGLAYVFGMVLPLFAISVLWERYDLKNSRLFRRRTFTWHLGPWKRTTTGSGLAAGTLLVAMGVWTLWGSLSGNTMPSAQGWQGRASIWLQSFGRSASQALAWIPGWLALAMLAAVAALLVRHALRETGLTHPTPTPDPSPAPAIGSHDRTNEEVFR